MWTLRWWLSRFNPSGMSPLHQAQHRIPQPLCMMYDDMMAWTRFPHNWPFARISTHYRWIPSDRASYTELQWCLCCYLQQVVDETIEFPVIWKAMALMWCNCNVHCISDLERPLMPSPTPNMASIMYLFAGTSRAIVALNLVSGSVNGK